MQTIRPAKNQLFCKPIESTTKTASGLFIPEKSTEKPKIATVINIGEDVTQFKPDDEIIYKSYTITDVKLDKQDYFLVSEEDVLGVIVNTD